MSKNSKANNIRLISGRWRGTRLPVLDSHGLRPTTDRVRETLFNWLMHDIPGARCLDLFAGSGALGLECLSRGAAFVQFVEMEKKVAAALRSNMQRLSITDQEANLYQGDASSFLAKDLGDPFNLVFLDPPFRGGLLTTIPAILESQSYLAADALIYLEQSAHDAQTDVPEHWQLFKQAKAGQTLYALYRRS